MLVRERVRRLLQAPSRFRSKLTADDITEDLTTASLSTSTSHDASLDQEEEVVDPYADVRDKMEALSARDRAQFALNDTLTENKNHITVPWWIAYTCYTCYAILLVLGQLRDFCAWLFQRGRYIRSRKKYPCEDSTRFAPLFSSWEGFYTRRIYDRVQDCFNRPLCSSAGVNIQVLERYSRDYQKSMELVGASFDNHGSERVADQLRSDFGSNDHISKCDQTGSLARLCLNLGSYNYLGFADDWKETCSDSVHRSLNRMPVSCSSNMEDYGTTNIMQECERTVATFIGKPDALVLNMGYNTNATIIPALVGPGDLIVSDALNHTSIVSGARASGAAIRVFPHDNMIALEKILKQAIVMGRPRTRRPWRKILVVVEGVYSMEGEYCDLRNIVRLCKYYGAYVYLDEAHSIGAMGPTGRGCAEYTGVDPADIDVMMGTFTKSFCGMGGYVAASKDIITHLRKACAASAHHNAMSPTVCQQILTALRVIMGDDGTCVGKRKLQALRDNSNYFRMRLQEMGLQVLGQFDSPVIPVMVYHMTKMAALSRECFKRGIAVVVVGAPAVPVLECRARFCMSAGLSREQLDWALNEIDQICDVVAIRHGTRGPISIAPLKESSATITFENPELMDKVKAD